MGEFTDKISVIIFALILLSAIVFVIMSKYVIGPIKQLKKGEKIVLSISAVGIILVVVFAALQLLFRIVF